MKAYRNEDGLLHREDGPAITTTANSKHWYINGKRHRTDGPAIIWATGVQEWWINGKLLTKEEFKLYKFFNKV